MKRDENAKLRLMASYIDKAAEYGVSGSTDGQDLSLETLDLALSYLRRVQAWWMSRGEEVPPELAAWHVEALAECIEDAVHSRTVYIETEFLRLMARPTREGHALDRGVNT